MKAKSPFRLFKRTLGSRVVWYYTTYDEYGKRFRFSTGMTSKTSANNYCLELAKTDRLIPIGNRQAILFSEYAKNWWDYEKCPYITSKRENGYVIGKTYAATNKAILDNRILPRFAHMALHEITVADIESWMRGMLKGTKTVKALSAKSIRNYFGVLSVMLDEAVRLGYIDKNPCKSVRHIAKKSKQRGILTLAEAKQLFSDPSKWFNRHAYAANLLASVTGMRLSEIRALRCEDVNDRYVHVEYSISDKDGVKSTKTGDVRELPVPPRVMDELHRIKGDRIDGFLFCTPEGNPYGRHMFLDNLKDVMDVYEIDWKSRIIGFHSWRHFLNTQLLSHGISGEKTREITGHASEAMTERYKHFQLEDYRDILDVTSELV